MLWNLWQSTKLDCCFFAWP